MAGNEETAKSSASPETNAKLASAFKYMEQWLGGQSVNTEHIAQSPSSTVYRVYSSRYTSDVAVKIVETSSPSVQHLSTFLKREIEICRSLSHPFICHTYGIFFPQKTQVAFVFQYYHGGTMLDMILKNNKVPEEESAIIFRQLIEAVRYLHTNDIVHRDVKLENILFDNFGNVKLADFGFARRMRPYSCPDVVKHKEYDPFSNDWYSLGVVLYTLISGRWPYNLQELEDASKSPTAWPKIWYPTDMFTVEAIGLLQHLLHEIGYMRADYQICLNSKFMAKYGQGPTQYPIVRGPYNALTFK